ncbi:unnamed protein product [Malus baccata var. baccata]
MLARDGGLIPIDSPDWHKIDSSKLDRVWSLATIEWTNSRAAGKEEKVRGIVETKIHDRFRTWRAKLRKLYYVPFENSEQRKHCDDARAEEHDGCEPDRLAFENLEVEVCERGEGVTTEVRNRIYAELLGPEKRNQVRGFGLGVGWADVPGIYLREAYEAHKHEANEKTEKMKKE